MNRQTEDYASFEVYRCDAQAARRALYDAEIDVPYYIDQERTSVITVERADLELASQVIAPYLLPTLWQMLWRNLVYVFKFW